MSRFKTFATVSLVALSFAASAAHAGVTTFASTTDVNTNDIVWTDNGTSGTLNTTNTTTGNLVTFNYSGVTGLPSILNGNLQAYELINGGAGVTTTAEATGVAFLQQGINAAFSISYTLANPIVSGGVTLSNLLTATITPGTTYASIGGTDGTNAASYSAGTNTRGYYTVTFTSDFLSFKPGSTYSLTLGFNSVDPDIELDGNGNFLSSFTADLIDSFAANPVPTSIPEVPSLALLIVGMGAVGVAARRRAAAAV
jgi:hypothetical protein